MDDDLLTIRRALHSGPPSAEATSRARDLLTAEIAAAAAPPVGGAVAPLTRSPRKSWWGRGALLTGGLAALIAVGLVAVPALTGTDHEGSGGAPPGTQAAPATAQDLLLAAAQRAGEAPATRGKYWHVRKLTVAGPIRVGSYDVVGRWLQENWTPRDPGESSWSGDLQLGYRPRTAADERAWRAAGSPTSWTVRADTTGGTTTFSSAPGEPHLREEKRPVDKPFLQDLGGLSLAELAELPTDPAALRARVAADVEDAGDVTVFSALSQLVLDSPAPPAVRAAAFRALAGIPGVRTVGDVTDGNGRTGTGIELTLTGGDVDSRHLLIIDPETHLLLGAEHTGTVAGSVAGAKPVKASNIVILYAGWTDTEPALPKAP